MSRISRRVPEVLRRPEQGWSSLLLLLGLLTVVGISLTDSRMIDIGGQDRTESLLVVLLAGGLIGFLLARSSIGVVRAHLIGAAAAAFVLLMIAAAAVQQSGTLLPAGWAELQQWISILGENLDTGIAKFVDDGTAQPPPEATFLVLGAICWTTAQFSAFSIFRYGRGGPAVMATGVMLFLNVALQALEPAPDLLPVWPMLAVFSALAMLLLMRMQLTQQGYQWARRHIADTGEVSRLFLRTGTLFVALTVLGASSMTLVAMAPPQEVDVGDFEGALDAVGEEIGRWLLPLVGVPRGDERSTFDGYSEIPDNWIKPDGPAFTAKIEQPLRDNYWWAYAQDTFDGRGWSREDLGTDYSENTSLPIAVELSAEELHRFQAAITPAKRSLAQVMAVRPAEATSISEAVTAIIVDESGAVGDLRFQERLAAGQSFTVNSSIRDYTAEGASLTADELSDAGTNYPDWMEERYLQGRGITALTGEQAPQLADEIEKFERNPYDQAIELQRQLRAMRYEPEMGGKCNAGEAVADCLLRTGEGFCSYFATTMVMVLREMDIPSRMITGYLPGVVLPDEAGTYEVENQALHNWVEVYFPDYGWVRFDPTPGLSLYNQSQTAFIDEREVPPGGAGTPEPSFAVGASTPEIEPTPPPVLDPGCEDDCDDDDALAAFLIGGGIAGMLLLTTFGLLFVRLRRLPKGEGGLAFRGIVSLATRLGYGPHPSQTEYEYASSLSETIPSVRDDLYLVADARVESAYGQREIGAERQVGLRRAYARIRTALLRLSLRLRR